MNLAPLIEPGPFNTRGPFNTTPGLGEPMISLTDAKYIDGYRIWMRFADGKSGVINFAAIIQKFPAARPLVEIEEFKKFYLDEWPTLAWPCGFDYAPEALYELATGQKVEWLHNQIASENNTHTSPSQTPV